MRLDSNPALPAQPDTAYAKDLNYKLQALFRNIANKVNSMADGRVTAIDNATTAAPTTGTWNLGDIVRNSAPSGATPTWGWICTVGGTPGTWVALTTGGGGGGTGDVVGPAGATNNAIALFDTTTGKLIKDSATLLSSLATATALTTGLALKADLTYLKAYPTFRARKSASQSIASGTPTIITFNTIDWNVGTGYSSGTNRFTPLVAGYYSIQSTVSGLPAAGSITTLQVELMKNGVTEVYGDNIAVTGQIGAAGSLSSMVQMNGLTDYLQIRATGTTSGAAAVNVQPLTETYFTAHLAVPT